LSKNIQDISLFIFINFLLNYNQKKQFELFVNSIIIKTFTSLFFNNNRKSFKINSLIKYMFNFIILETIKIIRIIICYCIEKFKHKIQIFIYFEKQNIENMYFTLLTIAIFIFIIY